MRLIPNFKSKQSYIDLSMAPGSEENPNPQKANAPKPRAEAPRATPFPTLKAVMCFK